MATRRNYVDWQGKRLTPTEVAQLTGLPLSTVHKRMSLWWTAYEIINTPYKSRGTRPNELR
jgi:IclR helix-turn-helix domain